MLKDIFSIKNKIVIVTGGGRGIGRNIAISFAKYGAIVYSIDLKYAPDDSKVLPDNLFQLTVDILDKQSLKKAYKIINAKHSILDVLVNNAGITLPETKSDNYPFDSWEQTLNVNLTGAFNCSQLAFKYMKTNGGGSIINITSINSELAFPSNPGYVASKGGLKMLGKALARDWGKYGIRVNNLGPGYIKTDMTISSYLNEKTRKKLEERTMLGRWGLIEDLIGPCIFLASDASKYITGQDIYVDGGWLYKGL